MLSLQEFQFKNEDGIGYDWNKFEKGLKKEDYHEQNIEKLDKVFK